MSKKHIEECIRESLESYFKDLRGVEPTSMYEMIMSVVEKPHMMWQVQTGKANVSEPLMTCR